MGRDSGRAMEKGVSSRKWPQREALVVVVVADGDDAVRRDQNRGFFDGEKARDHLVQATAET